jgi:Flp pilus assembly protein TadG
MTQTQAPPDGLADIASTRNLPRLRGDEGGALVELGVTLPIILLIMTGIFAFSIALYQKLALAEGVSAGARILAAARGETAASGKIDPCAITASAITGAAPALSQSTMKLTIVINGVTEVNSVAANSASCSGVTMTAGNAASVLATYPCAINVFRFSFPSCSLGYQVAEQIQ